MDRAFPVTFEHTGLDGEAHNVFFKAKSLKETDLANIDGYVGDEARRAGNDAPHLARHVALVLGVEKERVKIDEKWYNVRQGSKAPPVIIDENDRTTLEHALGYVIHFNKTLIEREKYREAFEDYTLEDEEIPDSDPTPFPRRVEQTGS